MLKSIKHATNGISWTINNQRNFVLHLIISFLVLLFAFILEINKTEFILLIFAVILGLTVEMINTAVEEMTNLITIKWAAQAKIAKDVSAGMMLLTAIGTAIVGFIIFIPYFVR